jgi:hypothetical protein
MANKGTEAENYLEYLIREQENILSLTKTPMPKYTGSLSLDVKNCCDALIKKFISGGKVGSVNFTAFTLSDYQNTKKIGGKSKADFIITNGTNVYNVSLKYGKKYHLASPGVSKSSEIFYNAINDAFTSSRNVNAAYKNASAITPYILQIDKQLSTLKTSTKQNISSAMSKYVNSRSSSGGRIVSVFNNSSSSMADFYYEMKLNIVEECLTGKETTSSNYADYILNLITPTDIIFEQIDRNYVIQIANNVNLRISPKSRPRGRQEITFRFE